MNVSVLTLMISLYDVRHPVCAGKKSAKPANATPLERPRAQAGPPSSGTDMEPVSLPMEVWQRVASCMSTRDVAKGLAQTCKGLWNMSHDAMCLTSGSSESFPPLPLCSASYPRLTTRRLRFDGLVTRPGAESYC